MRPHDAAQESPPTGTSTPTTTASLPCCTNSPGDGFALIRHGKRTMETAQALCGVTQEEPGVSRLVSVRFD